MSTKLKLLPAFVMLLAGAFTSIITFVIGYTLKSALIILLFVLVMFYILGLVLQKLIVKFEEANKPKDEEKEEEKPPLEGTVVEKDESEINTESGSNAMDLGNRPPVER
jgi:flagellar biosynthesis/type III secretory pathway M-ring protein FliF/YscJ